MTLNPELVRLIREAKARGDSLLDIAKKHGVSKSTVSLYCRDLFEHPKRIYLTERACRQNLVVRQRSHPRSPDKRVPCKGCGASIRADGKTQLCIKCFTSRPRQLVAKRPIKAHLRCLHQAGLLGPGVLPGFHTNYAWLRPLGKWFCCGCQQRGGTQEEVTCLSPNNGDSI